MKVEGQIKLITATETVGEKGTFRKRYALVEQAGQYPQEIPIDFVQDKCDLLDAFNVGDEVSVSINLRGSNYNGKHYVSVQGWKIDRIGSAPVNAPIEPQF